MSVTTDPLRSYGTVWQQSERLQTYYPYMQILSEFLGIGNELNWIGLKKRTVEVYCILEDSAAAKRLWGSGLCPVPNSEAWSRSGSVRHGTSAGTGTGANGTGPALVQSCIWQVAAGELDFLDVNNLDKSPCNTNIENQENSCLCTKNSGTYTCIPI